MDFCGEIIYSRPNGDSIHSDVCWHSEEQPETREMFHQLLDEWLDNAAKTGGTGFIWFGNREELADNFKEEL